MSSVSVLSSAVHAAAAGLVDSVSVHRTVRVLLEDRPLLLALAKCLAVNVLLLLGSIYAHDKFLLPLVTLFHEHVNTFGESRTTDVILSISRSALTTIYTSCWLVPILGLCYILSLQWYQDIAQELFLRKAKGGGKKSPDVKNQLVKESYVLVAWLALLFSVHLMLTGVPKLTGWVISLAEASPRLLGEHTIVRIISSLCIHFASLVCIVSKFAGFSSQAVMYGWYGFDYHWASGGDDYKLRFKRVEDHWPYFMGFGLPYAVIMHRSAFLVGFGLFLIFFPFSIILSAESNFEVKSDGGRVPSVPVFKYPSLLADRLIRFALGLSKGNAGLRVAKKAE